MLSVVRVRVTAADIAAGRPSDACSCPVALAVQRATGDPTVDVCGVVAAGSLRAHFGLRGVDLPLAAVNFVSAFDRGDPVTPFEFDLDVGE